MNNGHVYSELQPAFTHTLSCDMPVAASILSNPINKIQESHEVHPTYKIYTENSNYFN